jgi:adenosylhomocysteine nucleosidase
LIVITGLAAEARIAAGPGILTLAGGGHTKRLEAGLEEAVAQGGRAILSFGIAGGLAPGLRPGSWLIARAVIDGPSRIATDQGWSARLAALIPGAEIVDVIGVDAPLGSPAQKRAAHEATGAGIADMESHIAARVAQANRLPFAVCRVVADPAERCLPPAALVGMRIDGSVDTAAVIRSLIRKPRQLPALVRLARDTQKAFRALFSGRKVLGPSFGNADFGEFVFDMARKDELGGPLPIERDLGRHPALGAQTS